MIEYSEMIRKQARLKEIAAELKQELFGIDKIIDRVIDLIRVWYLMPKLLARPVIVNLWGMTGVGKTQLVRRLVQKLEFNDRFVEVQMDGVGVSSGYSPSSLGAILRNSSIVEGAPGIILLDEMQRFRTISVTGDDVKVERYQDVWMLLSDGKFSLDSSVFFEIEMMLASRMYSEDYQNTVKTEEEPSTAPDTAKDKPKKKRKFSIYPYEAKSLKKSLKLPNPIAEIMTWSAEEVSDRIDQFKSNTQTMETDYTKMLVFISGNLDELFPSSNSVSDSDTDADTYYEMTKSLGPSDVKKALKARFKPEQIARFGSNNIIYPSMTRSTYEIIIKSTCEKYSEEIRKMTNGQVRFQFSDRLYKEIYENSVFPSQGTRPVFSAIHQILGSGLSELAMWTLEHNRDLIEVDLDANKQVLIGHIGNGSLTKMIPTLLELNLSRKKNSKDFNTLVAVHEAGHALIYALLNRIPPMEIKINLSSYQGGFIMPHKREVGTKQSVLDMTCILLAGTVSEALVFGEANRGTGHKSDLIKATEHLSEYIRRFGFDGTHSVVHPENANMENQMNTDVDASNAVLEQMMATEKERAGNLLTKHRDSLKLLVDELLSHSMISPERFRELIPSIDYRDSDSLIPSYGELWKSFNGTGSEPSGPRFGFSRGKETSIAIPSSL